MVLLSLYWQKKIKICQKVLANDLKDWFITVNNNKKKVKMKIQQSSIVISLNQTL